MYGPALVAERRVAREHRESLARGRGPGLVALSRPLVTLGPREGGKRSSVSGDSSNSDKLERKWEGHGRRVCRDLRWVALQRPGNGPGGAELPSSDQRV